MRRRKSLRRREWLTVLSVVLFAMTGVGIASQFAPSVLPYLPLPACDFRPLPIRRLSTSNPPSYMPSYGEYSYGSYLVVNSSRITSGSYVRGNVTFYPYPSQITPRAWVLDDFDYLHSHPEDLDKLSSHLTRFTDMGPCCADPMYGMGYRLSFNFTSEETSNYYFLFYPYYTRIDVDILPLECEKPLWSQPWVWAALGILGAISAGARLLLRREEKSI